MYLLLIIMSDITKLLDIYSDTIKEELNVKELHIINQPSHIKKIVKPLWQKISALYGKDTANIIKYGKSGNVEFLPEWNVVISDWGGNSWNLAHGDYELLYEWIDQQTMAAENSYIVELDLELNEDLKQEWLVRELSRFLNQSRKDGGYNVDDKLKVLYSSSSSLLNSIIIKHKEFLQQEALISSFDTIEHFSDDVSTYMFEDEEYGVVTIALSK